MLIANAGQQCLDAKREGITHHRDSDKAQADPDASTQHKATDHVAEVAQGQSDQACHSYRSDPETQLKQDNHGNHGRNVPTRLDVVVDVPAVAAGDDAGEGSKCNLDGKAASQRQQNHLGIANSLPETRPPEGRQQVRDQPHAIADHVLFDGAELVGLPDDFDFEELMQSAQRRVRASAVVLIPDFCPP
jgi:hypothetical protein